MMAVDVIVGLPETLYIIVTRHPDHDMAAPFVLSIPSEGVVVPVFGWREGAEEFVASPKFDVRYRIQEVCLEQLIKVGDIPVDIAREHEEDGAELFFVFNPGPPHLWEGSKTQVAMIPMRMATEVLQD